MFDGEHTFKASMEKRIKRWFKRDRNESDLVLFHHRFPTSTVNVKRAAHPFNTGDYFGNVKYVLAHNGVISNPKDLKAEHEKLGINYQSVLQDGTYNDSEALLWDFALTMEGEQEELKAYGGIAFICIKLVDGVPDKLYFGRNYGRPLNLFRNKGGVMLSSEGVGDEIDVARLYTFNYKINRLTNKFFRIPSYDTSKTDYKWDDWNYTTKRIEQKYTNNACGYGGNENYAIDENGYAIYPEDDDKDFNYDDNWNNEEYWDDATRQWRNVYNTHASRLPSPVPTSKPTIISDVLTRPSDNQVNSFLFRQIGAAQGHYESTYWALSIMHEELSEMEQTMDTKRELNLVERAMDNLCQDTNYVNEASVHPLWVTSTDDGAVIENPTQEDVTKALGV